MGSANCLWTPSPSRTVYDYGGLRIHAHRRSFAVEASCLRSILFSLRRRQSEPSCRKSSKLYADAHGLGLDSDTHCSWYCPVTNCHKLLQTVTNIGPGFPYGRVKRLCKGSIGSMGPIESMLRYHVFCSRQNNRVSYRDFNMECRCAIRP